MSKASVDQSSATYGGGNQANFSRTFKYLLGIYSILIFHL